MTDTKRGQGHYYIFFGDHTMEKVETHCARPLMLYRVVDRVSDSAVHCIFSLLFFTQMAVQVLSHKGVT